eukprot:6212050-Pleurochrysis_carterae.AAC.2
MVVCACRTFGDVCISNCHSRSSRSTACRSRVAVAIAMLDRNDGSTTWSLFTYAKRTSATTVCCMQR